MSFFDDTAERETPARRLGGGVVALTLAVLVLLGLAAYVAAALWTSGRLPREARAGGVSLSAQSTAQAEANLRRELGPALARPLRFVSGDREFTVRPDQAGVRLDVAGTMEAAGATRRWTPAALWDFVAGVDPVGPVLRVDEDAFASAVQEMSATFDADTVDGTVAFVDGVATPVFGREGLRVDVAAMRRGLASWLSAEPQGEPVELPVERSAPRIGREAVEQALTRVGRPAMSAPVVIQIGPVSVIAPPLLLGQALTMVPDGATLRPVLDGERLIELLGDRMAALGDQPRDATVAVSAGRLKHTAAVYGATWDVEEFENAVVTALVKPVGQRTAPVHAAMTPPRRTDAAMEALGVTRRVAAVRVRLGAPDAATRAALARMDDYLVLPGQTFSYARLVGAKGYGAQTDAVGSALFSVASSAGMTETSHAPPIRRDPRFAPGRAVSLQAGEDLRFTNPAPSAVLIDAEVEDDVLTVGLWGTPRQTVPSTATAPADGRPAAAASINP